MRPQTLSRLSEQLALLTKSALVERLAKLESALQYGAADDRHFEYQTVVHELEVHQVELEMQNRELRDSQAALEAATERYAILYEYAPVGYCTTDLSGTILQTNHTAKKILTKQKETLIGTNFAQIVECEPGFDLSHHLMSCFQSNRQSLFEAHYLSPAMGIRFLQIIATKKPLQPNGEQEILLAVIDRTSEKILSQHDHFLLHSSEVLAQSVGAGNTIALALQMAMGANDCMVILDVWRKGTRPERHVIEGKRSNPQQTRSTCLSLLQNMPADQVEAYIQRCRIVQKPATVLESSFAELFIDRKVLSALHEARVVTAVVAPLYARGQLIGVMTFLEKRALARHDQDTASNLLRYARQAAIYIDNAFLFDHAKAAVTSREQVLAVVSHDLRGPLSAIRMRSERLQQGKRASDDPHVRDAASLIIKYVERMDHLIGDLLDVSTICSGTLSMTPESIDLCELLQDATELWMPAFDKASISPIVTRIPSVRIWADRDRLVQALGNLIGNSLKFTPKGGNVRFSVQCKPPFAQITVADTGQGIEPEKLAYVFDKFFQAKQGDRAGIGLGLSIVKGIVTSGGGDIWATSKYGFGTEVHITVPLCPYSTRSESGEPAAVLIVEDDDAAGLMAKEILEEAGRTVALVANGKLALDFLYRHEAPKCILLDLQMPVMNGWEFLEQRQKVPYLARIDVVVFSSELGATERVTALNARFLPKNSNMQELIAATSSSHIH